ncbi:MAG: serine hydrolase, partial [Duodenibacillus sp.]|nr:serine hydrolase [Duodenibacillus sp.]
KKGGPHAAAALPQVCRKSPASQACRKAKRNRRFAHKTPRSRGPSMAMLAGLRKTPDSLDLSSSVAYMVDQNTGEVYFDKNSDVTLPIASVTKLMTAVVIAESGLDMDERIRITRDDYTIDRASSRLRSGMLMTRRTVLQAALMSSDNRAAHALARTYPGGIPAFVQAMNAKAAELEMEDSRFTDPTGLDNTNVSTARDLAVLADAAHSHEIIRWASTRPAATLSAGRSNVSMRTTNRLIGDPRWKLGLQKTGFTTAAGRCMVIQSEIAGRSVVLVLLDSATNAQRAEDMMRMRRYIEGEEKFEQQFARATPYALI